MECDLHKAWELLADFDKISFPVFLKTSRFVEIDLRLSELRRILHKKLLYSFSCDTEVQDDKEDKQTFVKEKLIFSQFKNRR